MKKKFTTTLDEELIKQVKIYAIEHDTSVAKLIEKAINKKLSLNKALFLVHCLLITSTSDRLTR